ncbi:MAG: UDP-N-acetylglucosamine 2-epimerase (non-hydrolyzing) [Pseudomonadota bacterium]
MSTPPPSALPCPPGAAERHIVCVVAARPNLMKMAPLMAALGALEPALALTLVHTGQHYDAAMNAQYFGSLALPQPDINLGVGSGSHAAQTAHVMERFEAVLLARRPAAVLVVGDVNSTLACALVAAKENVPVIHVEAGLRSYDRSMPEEINRVLTDQLSTLLFTSEQAGRAQLLAEGIDGARIHFTGNVMIDTLRRQLRHAVPLGRQLSAAGRAGFLRGKAGHGVVTLHRAANVDDGATLAKLMRTLGRVSAHLPLIFPVHPRTRAMLDRIGVDQAALPAVLLLPPQGYLEMLGLMQGARLVLTDSGGVQEETTALGVPCLTLRENTERPVTVSEGTNIVAGLDPDAIVALALETLRTGGKRGAIPALWDGHAAERVAAVVQAWLGGARAAA